jgi:phenylpropionate dioxygenase-like ring-hydroxylating dioxygenase large terminal subunit
MRQDIFDDRFFAGMETSILGVNEAQMLPPECYSDRDFFEFEKEAVFGHDWLCVGREAWIPKAGDYFTTSHADEPMIVVRTDTGEIKAMSSVCQHRAMLVAEGRGNRRRFLCPYHHWCYDLSGALVAAPAMEKATQFDMKAIKLPVFKVERWQGFIFINFDPDAPPLAPRLAAVTEAVKNYEIASAEGEWSMESLRSPWNWKVMFENNNDGYHANRLHHGPLHDHVPSRLAVFPTLPEDTAGYFRYNGTTHPDASFNATLKALLPVFPKLTEADRNRMVFVNLPPTLSLIIRSDMIAYIILRADGVDQVLSDRGWLVAPDAMSKPLFREKLAANLQVSAQIAAQDQHVDTLIQVGLRSRFAARGRYSWQEQSQREFNNWLVKRYRATWAKRRPHRAAQETSS